jgi:hypothetical protein
MPHIEAEYGPVSALSNAWSTKILLVLSCLTDKLDDSITVQIKKMEKDPLIEANLA